MERWLLDARDLLGAKRGRETFRTEIEARRKKAELELEHYSKPGRRRRSTLARISGDVILDEYQATWRERAEGEIAERTLANYLDYYRLHIRPSLGGLALRDITRAVIKDRLAAMRRAGKGRNTVRLARAALSVILSEAVEDEILTVNPAFQVRNRGRRRPDRMKQSEKLAKVRPFKQEELDKLLRVADATERPPIAAYFWIMGRAALRPAEAIGLRPENIDFTKRAILVSGSYQEVTFRSLDPTEKPRHVVLPDQPTKTGMARTVPMSRSLADRLRRYVAWTKTETLRLGLRRVPEYLLFSEAGTPLNQANAAKAFKRVLKRAELALSHSPYDLRHTVASLLLKKRTPLTDVAKLLGHFKPDGSANPATTLLWYAHCLPSGEDRCVDLLDTPEPGGRHLAAPGSGGDFGISGITSGVEAPSNGEKSEQESARPEGFEPPTLRSEV